MGIIQDLSEIRTNKDNVSRSLRQWRREHPTSTSLRESREKSVKRWKELQCLTALSSEKVSNSKEKPLA